MWSFRRKSDTSDVAEAAKALQLHPVEMTDEEAHTIVVSATPDELTECQIRGGMSERETAERVKAHRERQSK